VAKAYGVGEALHLAVLLMAVPTHSFINARVVMQLPDLCLSTVDSCHVKENQDISWGSTKSGWPFIRF